MKALQFDRLLTIIRQAHDQESFGFDLRFGNILITNDHFPFMFGFVGGADVLRKHPDRENIRWDISAAPELQPRKATRRRQKKCETLLAPTKASDVYGLANLVRFFCDDTSALQLLIIHGHERYPEERCSIVVFRDEYRLIRDEAISQASQGFEREVENECSPIVIPTSPVQPVVVEEPHMNLKICLFPLNQLHHFHLFYLI
jgi:hypothetical protein